MYTHVSRTKNGAEAINYVLGNGKGHNGHAVRNIYLVGVNMLPNNTVPFVEQMQPIWNKAAPYHTTQIDRFIMSFSAKELNAKDSYDVSKGLYICCKVAEKLFPDHQCIVAIQSDGASGFLHGHILVNDSNMKNFKGMKKNLYHATEFADKVDEICKEYITLDNPKVAAEKETRTIRAKKAMNEEIKKYNNQEIENAAKENRKPILKKEEYIWKEDLKSRIRKAAKDSISEADFKKRCEREGVTVITRKKTKKQPEYYLYELVDISGFDDNKIPNNLRSKSYKMGENYQPEGIAKMSKAKDLGVFRNPDLTDCLNQLENYNKPTDETDLSMISKKITKLSEKEPNIDTTDKEVELSAKSAIRRILAAFLHWENIDSTDIDKFDEMREHNRIHDEKWNEYKKWRETKNLPNIFEKYRYGIKINYLELEKQFKNFLIEMNNVKQTKPISRPAMTVSEANRRRDWLEKAKKHTAENSHKRSRGDIAIELFGNIVKAAENKNYDYQYGD